MGITIRKLAAIVACIALGSTLMMSGCTSPASASPARPTSDNSSSASTANVNTDNETETETSNASRYLPTIWDESLYPNYYRVDGHAIVAQDLEPGEIVYGPLDELGRCTGVAACVTKDMRDEGTARENTDMSEIVPPGLDKNAETDIPLPDGTIYHGFLYNRSHLLAKSLGGEEIPENLVTGTRMQNVGFNDGGGGMAYTESIAREWLDAHPNGSVYYAATPVYVGNELVCRSVYVDMRTSDGRIDMHVEVFNAAAGHTIDYATGAWTRTGETAADSETEAPAPLPTDAAAAVAPAMVAESVPASASEQAPVVTYIGNKNTHVFHYPSCNSVRRMKDDNKVYFYGPYSEPFEDGYSPCQNCNPRP